MTHTPAPGSALALAPGQTSLYPGTGANPEPTPLPPSKITRPPVFATDTALHRAGDGYYDWLDHVWSAAGCTRPIRLHGRLDTVDTRTGEITASIPTTVMPDGVIYKACGNRRHTVCPSCATIYQRDAYQLVRAGLAGGKSVPDTVSSHPAVFGTYTAPSFGPVHTRHVRTHRASCTGKTSDCRCRAEPCHPRRDGTGPGTAETCPHSIKLVCFTRHAPGDEQIGQPLCLDCYDHDQHAVWNHHAGELWRRTKQAIERHLNRIAYARGLGRVRVSHGKAAEYQTRGAVHFHILLRLDGVDPLDPDAIIPPPAGLTTDDLEAAVYATADQVFTTEPHPDRPDGWLIRWGDPQKGLDVRPIALRGDNPLTDQAVAGYLAKYATKGTEITGHTSCRLNTHSVQLYADPNGTHSQRLIAACWTLGKHPDYTGLRRWAHMLGFGGHFLTKARRYSVTFAVLRAARAHYRRTQTDGPHYAPQSFNRQDNLDDESILIVASLTYAGTGWHTTGDALLANTAADQARKRRQAGRDELAHEQGATLTIGTTSRMTPRSPKR